MAQQTSLLPPRIEAIQSARLADEKTLRLCFSEADAVMASIALSGLTYREIAARMGRSKSLVNAMAKGERGLSPKNTAAFCNATGTLLIVQYREMVRALDVAIGRIKERDRLAAIVAPTLEAWERVA
jgi:transcriptional regulator with XRE-family HTH domain